MSEGHRTAGEVLQEQLHAQVAALRSLDPLVRVDHPDAVHQMRVASRRLRSDLATYRPLVDRTRTDPVRGELRWLATALGRARDAEVLRARLLESAGTLAPELLLGPVVSRIDQETAARHRDAREALQQAMDDERYEQLVDSLEALVADLPCTDSAGRPATLELPAHVARSVRRVRRRARAVDQAATPQLRAALLHMVRKDAKRARYAAESAEPVFGASAGKAARRLKRLQQLLGEHQDSLLARQALREMGVAAQLAGENGFSFGLLHELEATRGERALRKYPAALAKATTARPARWKG